MALRSPLRKRSMGASAKTRVNSNSAMARLNIVKSMGPPAATVGKSSPNNVRYAGIEFRRARTA